MGECMAHEQRSVPLSRISAPAPSPGEFFFTPHAGSATRRLGTPRLEEFHGLRAFAEARACNLHELPHPARSALPDQTGSSLNQRLWLGDEGSAEARLAAHLAGLVSRPCLAGAAS